MRLIAFVTDQMAIAKILEAAPSHQPTGGAPRRGPPPSRTLGSEPRPLPARRESPCPVPRLQGIAFSEAAPPVKPVLNSVFREVAHPSLRALWRALLAGAVSACDGSLLLLTGRAARDLSRLLLDPEGWRLGRREGDNADERPLSRRLSATSARSGSVSRRACATPAPGRCRRGRYRAKLAQAAAH